MIPAFLFAHDLTVRWVAAWMVPLEATFDMIESELDRQRANVSHGRGGTSRTTAQHAARVMTSEIADQPSKSKRRGIIARLVGRLPWPR
jgi:hypothetical protein